MNKKIQVGVSCNANSELFLNFLLETMHKTCSGQYDIEFIIGKDGPEVNLDKVKNKDLFSYKIIEINGEREWSSESHGMCLDEIFKHFDENEAELGMIIDCDIAFLSKDWDLKMAGCLNDECAIVGSEYIAKYKYKGFPNVMCCMFWTKVLKEQKVSFKPKYNPTKRKVKEEDAKIFGVRKGTTIMLDVGWEVCYKLRKSGYTGCSLPYGVRFYGTRSGVRRTNATMVKPVFLDKDCWGQEHQLNGEPIYTHIGRGSKRCFNTHPNIVHWVNRVKEWLNRE